MHKSPAILFSLGGYAGNNFHDFTDIVIPLYLTSEHFNREVQFLITNNKPGWITKFKELITKLSKYPVIEIDNEDGHIHCFKTVIVGLKRHHGHKELTIDASSSLHSMKDFRNFLRTVYSLPRTTAIKIGDGDRRKKPRILIITRKRTRSFTNPGEIVELAKQLDFEVVAAEASMNLARFAKIVNSCDVIVGVHGAGLANMVFLPENAILIQIIPVGGFEWLASFDFGQPSEGMNLRYLEYKIKEEESTLVQTEHRRVVPPRKWEKFKTVYLNKQNVTLDVNRFKPTLLKALELLRQ
ncbi:protein O-linked-mannose beta-1,4-N-acetylglucosaminyltransferase 2-like [Carica papaya]|uniref:protein O-linked-mannose beta-1,4-N-acetylglucosaminyltransferase 2-like n=1 Tax=Carica papaya TaxID=3649 RepID=UPI000B8CC2DB|nr:protein O-linked-mannose beta-1,4-N-acetylglucosaminyltransferase 2-like [Carica papaya]